MKTWSEEIIAAAREQGYVETIAHRRRYLPDIKAKNFNLRSFAERTAMNSPIQGSAADIIKIAMINMEKALRDAGLQAKMLLQVHDELILKHLSQNCQFCMSWCHASWIPQCNWMSPLIVASHEGETWYDAK